MKQDSYDDLWLEGAKLWQRMKRAAEAQHPIEDCYDNVTAAQEHRAPSSNHGHTLDDCYNAVAAQQQQLMEQSQGWERWRNFWCVV